MKQTTNGSDQYYTLEHKALFWNFMKTEIFENIIILNLKSYDFLKVLKFYENFEFLKKNWNFKKCFKFWFFFLSILNFKFISFKFYNFELFFKEGEALRCKIDPTLY